MRKTFGLTAAVIALSAAIMAAPAQAGVVFAFEESPGGVTGTLSGSVNIEGVQYVGAEQISDAGILPSGGVLVTGTQFTGVDLYSVVGPRSFGMGSSQVIATEVSGDNFGIIVGFGIPGALGGVGAALPLGYVSGTDLSATITFAGETFDSLGITPGEYVYEFVFAPEDEVPVSTFASAAQEENNIVVRFSPGEAAVIPLPAGLPLLLAGLGGLALLRRKRG